jgi:hypothetical protein
MKPVNLVAVAVLAAMPLAVPTSAAADQGDNFTLSTDVSAALPGDPVSVTAVDNDDTSLCGDVPFTLSLAYIKVGGVETATTVASGTTDSDSSGVSASFQMPADAASTDASGQKATLSLAVDCRDQQTPNTARVASATAPSNTVALTVSAFTGTIRVSPRYASRGEDVEVLLTNCHGGPVNGTFISRTEVPTTFTSSNDDPTTLEASGFFQVPDAAPYGHSGVTGLCWQTDYGTATLFVVDYVAGEGSSAGSGPQTPPAPKAVPVAGTPTLTG